MQHSKIEWCDHTFNPWMGCTKVSVGCQFCYAEELMDHRYHKVQWGPQGERKRTSAAMWRQPLRWKSPFYQCAHCGWRGHDFESLSMVKCPHCGQMALQAARARVFCASLADVFEERAELEPWRVDLLRLIEQTPELDWLLLTKRPENVVKMIEQAQVAAGAEANARGWLARFSNVWVGATVENQAAADERIPALLQVPARGRFLSCEPLLGPVDLWGENYVNPNGVRTGVVTNWLGGLHWVIAGGESGHQARPMHPDWVRSLRDECQAAGVPFLFKQWGEYIPINTMPMSLAKARALRFLRPDGSVLNGEDFITAESVAVWRAGKAVAGRRLDGQEWNQFPGEV